MKRRWPRIRADFRIARVFYGIPAFAPQKLNHQRVQIFRARAHNNLGRIDRKTAKTRQMIGNCAAKLGRAVKFQRQKQLLFFF